MAIPLEMLLHPELLSNEQLALIIQERHLHVPNLEMMARDELLELFHHYCVPYGQRKYRDSGRGKLLNKVRDLSPQRNTKFNTIKSTQCTKTLHLETVERLKPPPDLLCGHIKRIKLETRSSNSCSEVNKVKRKTSIDADHLPSETPPRKKERKLITWP